MRGRGSCSWRSGADGEGERGEEGDEEAAATHEGHAALILTGNEPQA